MSNIAVNNIPVQGSYTIVAPNYTMKSEFDILREKVDEKLDMMKDPNIFLDKVKSRLYDYDNGILKEGRDEFLKTLINFKCQLDNILIKYI